MARTQSKTNNRRDVAPFFKLPRHVFTSDEYFSLSSKARCLLIDLCTQYRGNNNGDLCATWKIMKKCGWKSRATIFNAIKELIEKGFIEKTAQGYKGTPNKPNLYALTWLSIDECNGKLDVSSTNIPSSKWKNKL